MKLLRTFLSFVLGTFLLTGMAQAHYFRGDQLTSNAWLDKKQIITLSDYHSSGIPHNAKTITIHNKAVIDFAQKMNAAVIVEDGISFYQNAEFSSDDPVQLPLISKKDLAAMKLETPIHGVASACQHAQVPCTNVEFRMTNARPLNVYWELLQKKKQKFLAYEGDIRFKNYFVKKIQELESLFDIPAARFIEQIKNSSLTLDAFIHTKQLPLIDNIKSNLEKMYFDEPTTMQEMRYNQQVKKLFNGYACAFIDLEILYAIAQYQKHDTIIICAGDFHIQCVNKALKEIGYSHSLHVGMDAIEIEDDYYLEPTALDIQQAFDAFDNHKQHAHRTSIPFLVALVLFGSTCLYALYRRIQHA